MDRGAWWTTTHGVEKSDKTEQLTLTNTQVILPLNNIRKDSIKQNHFVSQLLVLSSLTARYQGSYKPLVNKIVKH